jgi:uncharacterized protein
MAARSVGHRPTDPADLASWDRLSYTIAKTGELLREWGFPAEKPDAVSETVRAHRPQDEPESVEAIVLRVAGILEQFGAAGTFREPCCLAPC